MLFTGEKRFFLIGGYSHDSSTLRGLIGEMPETKGNVI